MRDAAILSVIATGKRTSATESRTRSSIIALSTCDEGREDERCRIRSAEMKGEKKKEREGGTTEKGKNISIFARSNEHRDDSQSRDTKGARLRKAGWFDGIENKSDRSVSEQSDIM